MFPKTLFWLLLIVTLAVPALADSDFVSPSWNRDSGMSHGIRPINTDPTLVNNLGPLDGTELSNPFDPFAPIDVERPDRLVIGYTSQSTEQAPLAAVPEAASFPLLAAGFAAALVFVRRKR